MAENEIKRQQFIKERLLIEMPILVSGRTKIAHNRKMLKISRYNVMGGWVRIDDLNSAFYSKYSRN